jgi:hypothetical protein
MKSDIWLIWAVVSMKKQLFNVLFLFKTEFCREPKRFYCLGGTKMEVEKKCNIRTDCQFQSPKQVAAAIACSVTVPSTEMSWVARNGNESLFALLEYLLPEVAFDFKSLNSLRIVYIS